MKADILIIGAGPAGLLLGHLLRMEGLRVVILERQSRAHVEGRIRAGVLERVTIELMDRIGLSERMHREGIIEEALNLADGERLIRIAFAELTGKTAMIYGQTEITKDLMDAAGERGLEIVWEAADVRLHDIESDAPFATFAKDGTDGRVEARAIAGCDGFHGVSRRAIAERTGEGFERVYPFGWLGILADVPPCHGELIYANHARGFALASFRSWTRSRYYIQVPLDERLEDWPDERLWDELAVRLGPEAAAGMTRGPAIEKSIAPLRSFVFEPMALGRLFLAGDAAHIVPPTGAKGLNLAASDVHYLGEALIGWLKRGDEAGLRDYSARALARVWKCERFSWYLTNLMHRFPDTGPFERRMQTAELDYIAGSPAMRAAVAENFVGVPL